VVLVSVEMATIAQVLERARGRGEGRRREECAGMREELKG
jgi:hypothetical protein